MRIYNFYPLFTQQRHVEQIDKWNEFFAGRLAFELQGDANRTMSVEAMEFVSIYGSFFIQFPWFTYIQVGGFEGQPFKLPRYAFDSYILIEVSRQLAYIDKRLGEKGESGVVFLVELGYYSCQSVSNALNL